MLWTWFYDNLLSINCWKMAYFTAESIRIKSPPSDWQLMAASLYCFIINSNLRQVLTVEELTSMYPMGQYTILAPPKKKKNFWVTRLNKVTHLMGMENAFIKLHSKNIICEFRNILITRYLILDNYFKQRFSLPCNSTLQSPDIYKK